MAASLHFGPNDEISFEALIDKGYVPPMLPDAVRVGMYNPNVFADGILNMGWQTMMDYLIRHEVNVYLTFADTIYRRMFLNSDLLARDLDILSFSIPFEDTYLNVLRMLEQSGTPIHARDRSPEDPLVVFGGMAMINPMPLSEFADVCILGDGREPLRQICERIGRHRGCSDKTALLQEISDIPGVYIPSHYRISLDDNGMVADFEVLHGPAVVEASPVLPLDEYPITTLWTSRFSRNEFDDYFSIMGSMGCRMKCPYCVVGHSQGDREDRKSIPTDVDHILALAEERRALYGTNYIKIVFSSSYTGGEEQPNSDALKTLLDRLLSRGFRARLGSLSVRQADDDLFRLLKAHGISSSTWAPETVESLRPTIGKGYFTDEMLHQLARLSKKYGLHLGLYMLGGLPGETLQHTREMGALIRSIWREMSPSDAIIEVCYNPRFPKAQTPYQWLGGVRPEVARYTYRLLRHPWRTHQT